MAKAKAAKDGGKSTIGRLSLDDDKPITASDGDGEQKTDSKPEQTVSSTIAEVGTLSMAPSNSPPESNPQTGATA